MRDNVKGGALTEVTFYILLALHAPRHGYAVMQFIQEKTDGRHTHAGGRDSVRRFECAAGERMDRPLGGRQRQEEGIPHHARRQGRRGAGAGKAERVGGHRRGYHGDMGIIGQSWQKRRFHREQNRKTNCTRRDCIMENVTTRKYYRFFGGFLTAQERWLNKMADRGCRKSKLSAAQYRSFLEDMGYRVFYKNINLNYSVGKVRLRPWAEKGGRIATNSTTFNRELFIVEKENDGRPFELHSTYEDRMQYYRNLRAPWLFLFAMSVTLGILARAWLGGVFAVFSLVPLALYQLELIRLGKEARTREW